MSQHPITYPQIFFDSWTTKQVVPRAEAWKDRFTFQLLCLTEGICPLCRVSLEPTTTMTPGAGLCRCCGYSFHVRIATPEEVEHWELTDEEERRVITTKRVLSTQRPCEHPLELSPT